MKHDLTVEPKEIKGAEKAGSLREKFFDKHGEFLERIAAVSKVKPEVLTALIGRESQFDPNAKNEGGSSGLMQLIGVAFDDMHVGGVGRAKMYVPFFAQIKDAVPADAPAPLRQICELAASGEKIPAKKWNSLIEQLRHAKFNPAVSLAVGGALLTGIHDRIEAGTREPRPKDKAHLDKMLAGLKNPRNIKKIYTALKDLGHVGPNASPEAIVKKIEALREELHRKPDSDGEDHGLSERMVSFLALRKYNGNPGAEAGHLHHYDIYAAIVLFGSDCEREKTAA